MKNCQWVVDTWVLETAENPEDDRALSAIAFLTEILENHCIAVDEEGEIVKEYHQGHIKPQTLVALWWALIQGRGKIYRYSKSFSKGHSQYLLQRLRFDPSDIKFVAIASKTGDKFLVSEDSHYTEAVQQYLRQPLGITVFSISDALLKARDP